MARPLRIRMTKANLGYRDIGICVDSTSHLKPTSMQNLGIVTGQSSSIESSEIGGSPPAITDAIVNAIRFLPTQGPLSVFVYYNTLEPFQHLPFEEAVLKGAEKYGCEPYLSESRYRQEFQKGRISVDELCKVLAEDLADSGDETVCGLGTRYSLRLAMLHSELLVATDAEIDWMLAESDLLRSFSLDETRRERVVQSTKSWVMRSLGGIARGVTDFNSSSLGKPVTPEFLSGVTDARTLKNIDSWSVSQWDRFVLRLLWEVCAKGVESFDGYQTERAVPGGIRDLILSATGENIDRLINEVIVRFCATFLDQGLAGWSLPHRDEGFAKAFANLLLSPATLLPPWLDGIQKDLEAIIAQPQFDAMKSIESSLQLLQVQSSDVQMVIEEALLALRGWAGMIWQMETNAPWLPRPAAQGSLNEYLAIRLLLKNYAARYIGKLKFGVREIAQIRQEARKACRIKYVNSLKQRTYAMFQVAENVGWTPEQLYNLSADQWKQLELEIDSFNAMERRRIWHVAYEREYRNSALNALAVHAERRRARSERCEQKPAFAAIFCIDDREESFRRHLEEVDPECITASAAGFFAVAMYYQGADHAHYRPLCPNFITPKHYVREEPTFSAVDASMVRAKRRQRIGVLTHQVQAGSRTMLGGMFTGVFGAFATFPLVARILAPRLTSQLRESLGSFVRPPSTELHIERVTSEPSSEEEGLGYSLEEMAAIVVRILQDTSLVKDFPRLVFVFGHGSSSLNNPHESAYNCGACSGGRGGANSRAFAIMANDPRVRRLVAARGIYLSDDVRFVGGLHNTCNDKIEYYDLDLLPPTHRALFRRAEASLNEARQRNAHERSRRFESAPLDMTVQEALKHVEERSEDLSQARPEYVHPTNALVFVGQRDWSRGFYADRRAFLASYDPAIDDEQNSILTRILQAAVPVCGGISLQYYFSTVDNEGYGCGSKLPHNVASLVGVMTGASSDLRPGLAQQMIEIHEPMRILFVVEATPAKMKAIIAANPGIAELVNGRWVQLTLFDPKRSTFMIYDGKEFEPYDPEAVNLPEVGSSIDWYFGQRGHLGFASVKDPADKPLMAKSEERVAAGEVAL